MRGARWEPSPAAAEKVVQELGQVRSNSRRRLWLGFAVLAHELVVGAGEWRLAGRELIYRGAERIEVAALGRRSSFGELGRHVGKGRQRARELTRRVVDPDSEVEVAKPRGAAGLVSSQMLRGWMSRWTIP
jgi:hypothetical protein